MSAIFLVAAVHLLRHLGEEGAASRIQEATSAVLEEGRAVTPELGGEARLSEMTAAIVARMPPAGPAR